MVSLFITILWLWIPFTPSLKPREVEFSFSPRVFVFHNKNYEETSTHMLKCQLRNTDKWKKELQDGIKNTDIGPQTHSLIIHVITRFATDKENRIKVEKNWKKKKLKQHLKKLEKHTKSWKNSKRLEKSYKQLKNV